MSKQINGRTLYRYTFKKSPRARKALTCERWQETREAADRDAAEIIKEWDKRAVLLSVEACA